MGWFSKDPIEEACKSDSFIELTRAIGQDQKKFRKAVKYLRSHDNLNLLLKILTLSWGHEELMKTLMKLNENDPESQAELDRLGKDGIAPIHLYAQTPGAEIFIRLMANNGANMDRIDSNGLTPLLLACSEGNIEAAKMLINNGARKIDLPNRMGWTPLHYACQLARPEIVALLIQEGANVNATSKDGFMPIHVAISSYVYTQHSPTSPTGQPWDSRDALLCAQLLMNNGADMEYKCSQGFAAKDVIKPRKKEGQEGSKPKSLDF